MKNEVQKIKGKNLEKINIRLDLIKSLNSELDKELGESVVDKKDILEEFQTQNFDKIKKKKKREKIQYPEEK